MKTALAIDSLLLRDDSIFLLELVLNLFPNSEIYTIAHKQGSILGTLETRPIVSSFLTHRIHGTEDLRKNFWLLPSAVKGIPLHPSIEKVIVISRGYIHGLNLPPHVEKLLYIVDWNLIDQDQLGWQRLFGPYVNQWRERALTKFQHIAVSSETLKNQLELPNAEVIVPTYRTEEYPFVRDEDHNFMFDHHLLLTNDLSTEEFRAVAKALTEKKQIIRALGPDQHLSSLRAEFPEVDFAGDHCEATTAMYSHQAKAIWDFSQSFFPSKAFGAFATGRPVVVRDTLINREFLTKGAHFLSEVSSAQVKKMAETIEDTYLSADRRDLRRFGLKWNERLFKSRMSRFLRKND